jgi:hypothetical protein
MAEWWSVEVFHGEFRASQWQQSYSQSLIESAISHGAVDWSWTEHPYGVAFEVCFTDDSQWEAFRALPAVRAALDAVPDPVNGLLVYRGRGGGSGAPAPRRPRPTAGAGAAELPEPQAERILELTGVTPDRATLPGPATAGVPSAGGARHGADLPGRTAPPRPTA